MPRPADLLKVDHHSQVRRFAFTDRFGQHNREVLLLPDLSQGRPPILGTWVQYIFHWIIRMRVGSGCIRQRHPAVEINIRHRQISRGYGNRRHRERAQFFFLAITQRSAIHTFVWIEFHTNSGYRLSYGFRYFEHHRVEVPDGFQCEHGPIRLHLHDIGLGNIGGVNFCRS